jgi:hypothetical protein
LLNTQRNYSKEERNMKQSKIFIDILPSEDKKVCSNCAKWSRWGVQTGQCVSGKNKNQSDTCKKFEKISDSQKREDN